LLVLGRRTYPAASVDIVSIRMIHVLLLLIQ
jgi:hypothetical protein